MDTDLLHLSGNYPNQTHYYYFKNGFSCEECNSIVAEFSEKCSEKSSVFTGDTGSVRKSKICWLPRTDSTRWIYSKFLEMAKSANEAMFHFDLTTVMDTIQMAVYEEADGGKYDYHMDLGSNNKYACRKITMVCQLSDEGAYAGGNLEIMEKGVVCREQGCVICLPSFLYHRVTPILRGKRYSLVMWVCGPPLR